MYFNRKNKKQMYLGSGANLTDVDLSDVCVEDAYLGNNLGISQSKKLYLLVNGAIITDLF